MSRPRVAIPYVVPIAAAIYQLQKDTNDAIARAYEAAKESINNALNVNQASDAKGADNANGGDKPTSNEPPVTGATPGRETNGRTTQWEKGGGMDEANRDFDAKNPKNVVPLPDGGRRGTLPDGRPINVRPDSTDGRPTLEIQDGKNRDKVRYGP